MAPFLSKVDSKAGTRPGYYAARLISDIANPLFIPPFVLSVVGQLRYLSAEEFSWMLFLALLFYTVIPLILTLQMLRAGEIKSLDLPRQETRNPLFVYYILSAAFGSIILGTYFYYHRPFLALVSVIFFLNPLTGFLFNLRWKISIHAAGVASAGALFLTLLYLDSGTYISGAGIFSLFMLLVLLPLMIWARYYLGVHTPGEIIAGAGAGFLLTLTVLELMIHLW